MLRIQLAKDVCFGQKTDLTPIEDVLSYLIDFEWLNKCQERETGDNAFGLKQEMLPLTYEEFKLAKACQMEHLEVI